MKSSVKLGGRSRAGGWSSRIKNVMMRDSVDTNNDDEDDDADVDNDDEDDGEEESSRQTINSRESLSDTDFGNAVIKRIKKF